MNPLADVFYVELCQHPGCSEAAGDSKFCNDHDPDQQPVESPKS